jgi:hypothetical protein
MKLSIIVSIGLLSMMVFIGGSCKKDPPVGPPTCDTCKTDTTHHSTPNDTTSHNFVWTQTTLPGEGILTGCWVFGPKAIYVVGGNIYKWNGTKWTDVTPTDTKGRTLAGSLSGSSMFAFNEGDYWLTYAGVAYHVVDNTAIGYPQEQQNPHFTHSSWGTSSTDMYSVGDGGTILHFDGMSWTRMVSGTSAPLTSIWGTSASNIYASGFDDQTANAALLHYDGSSWQSANLSNLNIGLHGHVLINTWCGDSASHPVAVLGGSLVWRKTDNGAWRSDSGKIDNAYNGGFNSVGVFGNSINDLLAVGGWGWTAHWNGENWYRYPSLLDYSSSDFGATAASIKDNTFCQVGIKNGVSWIAIGQRK